MSVPFLGILKYILFSPNDALITLYHICNSYSNIVAPYHTLPKI